MKITSNKLLKTSAHFRVPDANRALKEDLAKELAMDNNQKFYNCYDSTHSCKVYDDVVENNNFLFHLLMEIDKRFIKGYTNYHHNNYCDTNED